MANLDNNRCWAIFYVIMCYMWKESTGQHLKFPSLFEKTEGSPCNLPSGERGECVNLVQCTARSSGFSSEHPPICGWTNTDSVLVCCKKTDSVHLQCGAQDVDTISRQMLRIGQFKVNFTLLRTKRQADDLKINKNHAISVVGGRATADIKVWPWMVALYQRHRNQSSSDKDYFCGGVLITDRLIVTAAHCFQDWNDENMEVVAQLGELELMPLSNSSEFKINKIIKHPNYQPPVLYHDIAVLKLAEPVTFTDKIRPICLPKPDNGGSAVVSASVTGWGATNYGGAESNTLMEINVPIISNEECNTKYMMLASSTDRFPEGLLSTNIICAGNKVKRQDSCQGDSGGPLMALIDGWWTLIGVVSGGFGCGVPGFPGIYTRVLPYTTWILEAIK